jgi:hypothetical protein
MQPPYGQAIIQSIGMCEHVLVVLWGFHFTSVKAIMKIPEEKVKAWLS